MDEIAPQGIYTAVSFNGRGKMKLICLDVETTGVACPASGLIQLAGVIEMDGEVRDSFDFHIRPFLGDEVSDEALVVNGITREELETYEEPQRIFTQFINILTRYIDRYDKSDKFYLVAYNARFDVEQLRAWFEKNGDQYFGSWFWHPAIDVMNMAALALAPNRPELANFKLPTVARFLGIEFDENLGHDAVYDVQVTRQLFHLLCDRIGIALTLGIR